MRDARVNRISISDFLLTLFALILAWHLLIPNISALVETTALRFTGEPVVASVVRSVFNGRYSLRPMELAVSYQFNGERFSRMIYAPMLGIRDNQVTIYVDPSNPSRAAGGWPAFGAILYISLGTFLLVQVLLYYKKTLIKRR